MPETRSLERYELWKSTRTLSSVHDDCLAPLSCLQPAPTSEPKNNHAGRGVVESELCRSAQ